MESDNDKAETWHNFCRKCISKDKTVLQWRHCSHFLYWSRHVNLHDATFLWHSAESLQYQMWVSAGVHVPNSQPPVCLVALGPSLVVSTAVTWPVPASNISINAHVQRVEEFHTAWNTWTDILLSHTVGCEKQKNLHEIHIGLENEICHHKFSSYLVRLI